MIFFLAKKKIHKLLKNFEHIMGEIFVICIELCMIGDIITPLIKGK
jgi:hypothetical protein